MEVLKSINKYPFKKIVKTSKNTTATPIIDQNLEFLFKYLSGAQIFRNEHVVMKLAMSMSPDYIVLQSKPPIIRQ